MEFVGAGFRSKKRRRLWTPSKLYGFVKSREAEGTVELGPKHGAFCLSAFRGFARWGMVSDSRCPYPTRQKDVVWPYTLTSEMDRIASFNRTFAHFRIRSVEDAIKNLAFSPFKSFSGAMPITDQWDLAKGGVIDMPRAFSSRPRRHAVAFCGYSRPEKRFLFANCWGKSWGDNGYGYLPFDYFRFYIDEAWVTMPGNETPAPMPEFDFFGRTERFCNPLGKWSAVYDLWDGQSLNRVAWAMVTEFEGHCDIEDFYVVPDLQCEEIIKFLAEPILKDAQEGGAKSVRYWIPHCDALPASENHPTVDLVLSEIGMRRSPSGCTWAHSKAEKIL